MGGPTARTIWGMESGGGTIRTLVASDAFGAIASTGDIGDARVAPTVSALSFRSVAAGDSERQQGARPSWASLGPSFPALAQQS